MASNQSVLEQLLQTALSGGGLREGQRAGSRDQTASASSGDLGDILGSLLGGGQMTAGSGATPSRSAPGALAVSATFLALFLAVRNRLAGMLVELNPIAVHREASGCRLIPGQPPARSSSRPKCRKSQV